jgi:DNA-directed RNA polymerase I, II, and III subunit RPABC1
METRALDTLKIILKNRGVVASAFDPVAVGELNENAQHMFEYGGVLVIFSDKSRISERDIRDYITFAEENQYTAGTVIVALTRPSDSVLNAVRRHVGVRENPMIQLFEIRHLQFDISAHRKVPRHRILKQEEVDTVFKEFNVSSASQLPKIDSQDAMARWVGARPGDVLEITGLCEASGENRRYRLCVESAADA